ncbi:MAG: hypothetical protein BWY60_00876 [Actinobacteria bacterium ADurb.Bin346]|nr:MAG: hypothetical protein BWY60_00876 [Actinobacteria bacterium ADurb.Bin346]
MGMIIESIDTDVEVASSAILTGILPIPPVAAVTVGRIVRDLTACILPEMNKPAIMASTVFT